MGGQVNDTQPFYTMFATRHAELGSWFRDHTPIDARVAISTHGGHWRPEMSLAGRAVMTSYAGCVLARVSPWLLRLFVYSWDVALCVHRHVCILLSILGILFSLAPQEHMVSLSTR